MENMSKALLIAAGVLIGVMIFGIFVYEMSYVATTSSEVNERMQQEEIQEFNAQFLGYADRGIDGFGYKIVNPSNPSSNPGYNGISVQEFATIYNTKKEWNINNPTETIKLTIGSKPGSILTVNAQNINNYIANDSKTAEDLFTVFFRGDTTKYYFTFQSTNLEYDRRNRKNKKYNIIYV